MMNLSITIEIQKVSAHTKGISTRDVKRAQEKSVRNLVAYVGYVSKK